MKAKDFDSKFDKGESDIIDELDLSTGRRPNQAQKRVNVDFPTWMIDSLDKEASRLGVTRVRRMIPGFDQGLLPSTSVPQALKKPPKPWATDTSQPCTWAAAVLRNWRTLSWMAYMPYMPECI